MKIEGSVALVTGANRGLGRVYARELVRRGAAKVYGAARDPRAVTEPGVTPVGLDITDPELVAEAAARCADVSLLVNNAGVMQASTFTDAPSLDAARLEMETNYFGTLRMCRAFAPVLAANGGGAVVNMLSVTSFYTNPLNASYGASKAAAWSLTNGIRIELHHQGTLVVAVHAGFINTDMAALVDAPKISPESVAQQACDAVKAGQVEVLADERTRFVKASLPRDHELIYPPVQAFWDADVTGSLSRASGQSSDRHQVAYEDEGLARRYRVPGAPVPVGQIRRDYQLTAAADLHTLHALVPAGDDLPGAELELQGIAPIPARVEFFSSGERDPDIVNLDHVARVRYAAVTFPDVGDLQFGRRFAAGKVDLGPSDAHTRLSPQ